MFRIREKKRGTKKSIQDSSNYFNTSWACPEVVYLLIDNDQLGIKREELRIKSLKIRIGK
jgi:hypothetical protein